MQKAARLVLLNLVVMSLYADPQTERSEPPFANPPMLYSRDGQLHVDLVAAPGTYTIGDRQFQGMLFNGQYMPPVWHLRAGDTLTVTLHTGDCGEVRVSLPRGEARRQGHDDDGRSGALARAHLLCAPQRVPRGGSVALGEEPQTALVGIHHDMIASQHLGVEQL